MIVCIFPDEQRTPKAGPGFTRVFDNYGQSGSYYDFTDYVPDLRTYLFDNLIRGACQTGL